MNLRKPILLGMLSVLSLAFLTSVQAQTITFTGDSWAYEAGAIVTFNGDTILNVPIGSLFPDGNNTSTLIYIDSSGEGVYTVTLLDDWGDGGTSYVVDPTPLACAGDCAYSLTTAESTTSFSLTSETPGCTDPAAINYDDTATLDDGSCIVDSCADGETFVYMMMNDSWGDGWNGNTYNVFVDGASVATGSLDDAQVTTAAGSDGYDLLCLPSNSCMTVESGGGSFLSEVSWTLVDPYTDASIATHAGGGFYSFYFGETEETCGCTDPTALNFDSGATVDDNSCVSPACYDESGEPDPDLALVQFMMYDTFGDGWDGTTYTLYDGSGASVTQGSLDAAQFTIDPGANGYDFFCLSTTECYTLELSGGAYPGEKEWQIIDYTTGDVLYDYTNNDGFGTFGVSGPGVVCGCTDPDAFNFDAGADGDDGSCFSADCAGNADSTTYLLHLTHDIYLYWGNNSAFIYDLVTGDTVLAGGMSQIDGSYIPDYTEDVVSHYWQFCVPNDACLVLSAGGGSPAGLPLWEITTFDGMQVHSGSLGVYDIGFGANVATCVSGCTLAAAINYDPAATVDDASCVVCDAGQLGMTIGLQDDFGSGWNPGNDYYLVSEATGDTVLTGTMAAGSTSIDVISCVDVGCYTFSTGAIFTTEGWSLSDNLGNEYASLTYGPTEGYPVALGGTDATDCGFAGCTDDTAVNYNLSAEVDDESCNYAPANDNPETAQAIACGLTLPGTLEWASGDEYSGTTILGNPLSTNGAIWYEFNAGSNQQVTFNLCASEDAVNGVTDTDVVAFVQNDDGTLTPIAQNDDNAACNAAFNSILTINAEQGNNYFLRVGHWSSTSTQTGIVVEVTCADCDDGFPTNDDLCTLALPLIDGGDADGSTCCTGPDDDFSMSSLSFYATAYGVWYQIAQAGDFNMYNVTIDATGTGAIGYAIYDGDDCTELNNTQAGVVEGSTQLQMNGWFATELAGPVTAAVPVDAGETVFVFIWTTEPDLCGTYTIAASGEVSGCTDEMASNYDALATVNSGCLYIDVVQDNDSCSNAIPVACGSDTSGNTGGATAVGNYDPCGDGATAGVWYTLDAATDPPSEQLVTINTCGSTVNTEFSLFQGIDSPDAWLEVSSLDIYNWANISAVITNPDGSTTSIAAGDLFTSGLANFFTSLEGGDYTVVFTNEGSVNDGLSASVIDSYGDINTLICSGDCSTAPSVCLTLSMALDAWPTETSWDVVDEGGNIVASGSGYTAAGGTVTENFCVAAGSYTLNMYDSWGDGGPDYTLTTSDGDELVNNSLGGSLNSDAFSVSASPYNLPAGGTLEQSFTIFGGTGFCSSLVCIDDANNTVISSESCDNGQTTQIVTGPYTGTIGILVSAGLGSIGGPFDLSITCEDVVYGCMDALACNYNANANVDDSTDPCDFTSCLDCETESWSYCYDNNESWSFTLTNPAGGTMIVDLAGTTIEQNWDELVIADAASGDVLYNSDADPDDSMVIGTDAVTVSFTSDASVSCVAGSDLFISMAITCAPAPSTGCADSSACNFLGAPDFADNTLCDFSCNGCTEPGAINYDLFATVDDGSCCYGASVHIDMFDSWGDGWNGNTYELYLGDVLVATGGEDFTTGVFSEDDICLDDAGCYTLVVGGGSFQSEVSWALSSSYGSVFNGDIAGGVGTFSVGLGAACTSGCTVLCATNYEDPATVDFSDDSLCNYDLIAGCTYVTADNYDEAVGANYDDGTCTFSLSNDCPTDLNEDGATTTSDLLIFLGQFGTDCPE
jgi:hypothetical protein